VELYIHSPNTPSWCGAQLKHRDNFTFFFTLPQEAIFRWSLSAISFIHLNAGLYLSELQTKAEVMQGHQQDV
jgi:hypothetical protein